MPCDKQFQCPHGLELLLKLQLRLSLEMLFQCPNGIELLQEAPSANPNGFMFQCPNGLELLRYVLDQQELMRTGFNALTGLSCYSKLPHKLRLREVSIPSWAWVVTARMSNILNFLWYFLCIPAIYKCILAYLPIFSTNYLSFWGANPLVLFWELAFRTTLLSFYW